jgi:hypothetical protein
MSFVDFHFLWSESAILCAKKYRTPFLQELKVAISRFFRSCQCGLSEIPRFALGHRPYATYGNSLEVLNTSSILLARAADGNQTGSVKTMAQLEYQTDMSFELQALF